MPTFFKMSDGKQQSESPTVVIAETTPPAKSRNYKKYVIIAVSAISAAAIILTAILVGMYMFTEAQKEIIKYSLKLGENSKQEVTSDPNENVVQYHVSNPGQETWIVNDFNKDIQVVKIQTAEHTDCYVNALNRSSAMDPSKIAKPLSDKSDNIKGSTSLGFTTSGTPISDTSFLSKTARDMCKGASIYWVYPVCLDKSNAQKTEQTFWRDRRDTSMLLLTTKPTATMATGVSRCAVSTSVPLSLDTTCMCKAGTSFVSGFRTTPLGIAHPLSTMAALTGQGDSLAPTNIPQDGVHVELLAFGRILNAVARKQNLIFK